MAKAIREILIDLAISYRESDAYTLIGGVLLHHNNGMVKSVEGVYRNRKVELMEPLAGAEGSRVI